MIRSLMLYCLGSEATRYRMAVLPLSLLRLAAGYVNQHLFIIITTTTSIVRLSALFSYPIGAKTPLTRPAVTNCRRDTKNGDQPPLELRKKIDYIYVYINSTMIYFFYDHTMAGKRRQRLPLGITNLQFDGRRPVLVNSFLVYNGWVSKWRTVEPAWKQFRIEKTFLNRPLHYHIYTCHRHVCERANDRRRWRLWRLWLKLKSKMQSVIVILRQPPAGAVTTVVFVNDFLTLFIDAVYCSTVTAWNIGRFGRRASSSLILTWWKRVSH